MWLDSYQLNTSLCKCSLRGYCSSLKGVPSSHLSMHYAKYGCAPPFSDTPISFRQGDQRLCEVVEGYGCHIQKHGDSCVSVPSLSLLGAKLSVLMSVLCKTVRMHRCFHWVKFCSFFCRHASYIFYVAPIKF